MTIDAMLRLDDLPVGGELVRRVSGRVIPVTGGDRVLLVKGVDPSTPGRSYWYTIGGAVEGEESLRACAARERREETGIVVDEASRGEPIGAEEVELAWGGPVFHQQQTFFALPLAEEVVADTSAMLPGEAAMTECIDWVALADLESGDVEACSESLVEMCRTAVWVAGGA